MDQHPASEAPHFVPDIDGSLRPETEEERIARIKQTQGLKARIKKINETAAAARQRAAEMPTNTYKDFRPGDRVLFTDAKGDHHSARVAGRNADDILIDIKDEESSLSGIPAFYVDASTLIMVERGSGHPPLTEDVAARPIVTDVEEVIAGIVDNRKVPVMYENQQADFEAEESAWYDFPVAIKRLHSDARIPTQAKRGDAGYDLHSIESVTVYRGSRRLIGTGIAVAIPEGYVGLIMPRSGLANKNGIDILGGVIDAGYRGEVKVILQNHDSATGFAVNVGDRIAQLVIQPVQSVNFTEVDTLPESDRAAGGFGSTGQ